LSHRDGGYVPFRAAKGRYHRVSRLSERLRRLDDRVDAISQNGGLPFLTQGGLTYLICVILIVAFLFSSHPLLALLPTTLMARTIVRRRARRSDR
jgi:hypothetical protein